MTFSTATFNRIDRGYPRDLVLIPGWATDVRIFEPLALPYNYILPNRVSPDTFVDDLQNFLTDNSLREVSLLGWSMGGFLAADFAKRFPSQVAELFLVSVRSEFDKQALADIKTLLEKDRRVYLYSFYMQCLRHCPTDQVARFKRTLLKSYLETMTPSDLMSGLDYLAQARIDTLALSSIPTLRFFHGQLDEITPIAEAHTLADSLPGATFHNFPDRGHIVFLTPTFSEVFDG
jgi:pimeloyl-ACP methyl ester carboxylesterase